MEGIARIDDKPYRFMGRHPDKIPAMQQIAHSVTATHTYYEFQQGGVTLRLAFFTPAILTDLDLLSLPVSYLTWSALSTDGAVHRVSVLLEVDPLIAVNDSSQQVISFRNQTASLNVLSVGSRDQNVLDRSGDNLRIGAVVENVASAGLAGVALPTRIPKNQFYWAIQASPTATNRLRGLQNFYASVRSPTCASKFSPLDSSAIRHRQRPT